jgi:CheY-like chemotaxis protein
VETFGVRSLKIKSFPASNVLNCEGSVRKRELHTGRHMPIIALTAHALDSFREECAEAGMDAFLPKPIQFDQLLDVLDQVLNVDRKPEVLASIRR